jgi:hypothetical protein
MKRYRVTSHLRDKAGKTLRTVDTFDGVEESAKCALVEAHKKMVTLAAQDLRIDCFASTIKGPGEEISTVDYADELDRASGEGLMQEIRPEDLEPKRGGLVIMDEAEGIDLTTLEGIAAHGNAALRRALDKVLDGSFVYGLHGDQIVSVDEESIELPLMFPKITPEQEETRKCIAGHFAQGGPASRIVEFVERILNIPLSQTQRDMLADKASEQENQ